VIAPAPAATAAPIATASTPTTTAAAATAGSAAPAFAHWPSLVHYQRSAEEILAIAGLNCAIRFFIVAEFREPESARLTGELIADDLN
jgi:hypothetical protein